MAAQWRRGVFRPDRTQGEQVGGASRRDGMRFGERPNGGPCR